MSDIKIIDKRNDKPLSIEQAINKLAETKALDMRVEAKKAIESFQVTDASPAERMKFLTHALKHYPIRGDNDRAMKQLLWYRMRGMGYKSLAKVFHSTPNIVKKLEEVAVDTLKEALARVRETQVPIIGMPN